jgi:hypothetical protein
VDALIHLFVIDLICKFIIEFVESHIFNNKFVGVHLSYIFVELTYSIHD